jgi:hypothetical protein
MNNSGFHPLRKHFLSTLFAAFVVLVLAAAGCAKSTHIATRMAGHQITAIIQGNHSIESEGPQGMISSQFGKITVERSRVRLDDDGWTKIPEDVPLEVTISRGKIHVTAGSVRITRTTS